MFGVKSFAQEVMHCKFSSQFVSPPLPSSSFFLPARLSDGSSWRRTVHLVTSTFQLPDERGRESGAASSPAAAASSFSPPKTTFAWR